MTPFKNGGPAFPPALIFSAGPAGALNVTESGEPGLSVRDYFAAHAPPAPQWWFKGYDDGAMLSTRAGLDAQWRYVFADAMLAERAKGGAA